MSHKGFTLVELMIVVAVLGILAAIVLPTYSNHAMTARQSAAKSNLQTLRGQIELYRLQHRGSAPGYVNGVAVDAATMQLQLTTTTAETGASSGDKVRVDPYLYGPYVKKLPENPFNHLSTIAYAADFATAADGTSSGWLYNKETGEIRLNWTGADEKGQNYYQY